MNNSNGANRTNVLAVILNLIFLVVFNVFFFVIGNPPHNASVWISYGFIHFAYFMLVATPIFTRKGKSAAVFGFAIYWISSKYFILSLVVGIIFILIAPEGYTAALLIQLTIAGIYGIILIANLMANERTADAEEARQVEIDYVKIAGAQLKGIFDIVKDNDARRKVERAYDAIRTSPVRSHPSLSQTEIGIMSMINDLSDYVASGNNELVMSTADGLLAMINERNVRLKGYAR